MRLSPTISIFLLLFAPLADARPVTFCDVCPGYAISKKGNDVLIRCPVPAGSPPGTKGELWLTVQGCQNASVQRSATQVTVTCNWLPK